MKCALAAFLFLVMASTSLADVESGPALKSAVPSLEALAATGASAGKVVFFATERAKKPTIYVFIRHDQWSRPMARFLKGIDKAAKNAGSAAVVNVWLTDEPEALKTQLPKVQESLKFEASTLAIYEKGKGAPNDWAINGDAHATVIIAADGKVTKTYGFVSVNETLVEDVVKSLREAINPTE